MPLSSRDLAYLEDMQMAAHELRHFTTGITREEFQQRRDVQLITERLIQALGELANHVSIELQEEHRQIAWMDMVGQRNVIAHEYGRIIVDRLWDTVEQDLPVLIELLDRLLADQP
jgi:uncharacterized protein with HEPN domain